MTVSNESYYKYFFDYNTQYLFVNQCITLIYGQNLPSYCYYNGNDEIENFWNKLNNDEFEIIYWYLVDNDFIEDYNCDSMKNEVLDFIDCYFEN
jgi:hypothetical protein